MSGPVLNTCGNCRFRGDPIKHGLNIFLPNSESGYFPCERIKHDRNEFEHMPAPGQGAILRDGSGYFAALCVEEDFGCNKWRPKIEITIKLSDGERGRVREG